MIRNSQVFYPIQISTNATKFWKQADLCCWFTTFATIHYIIRLSLSSLGRIPLEKLMATESVFQHLRNFKPPALWGYQVCCSWFRSETETEKSLGNPYTAMGDLSSFPSRLQFRTEFFWFCDIKLLEMLTSIQSVLSSLTFHVGKVNIEVVSNHMKSSMTRDVFVERYLYLQNI